MREAVNVTGALLTTLHGADDGASSGARLEALVAKDTPYAVEMTAPLNLDIDNLYAGHRSHSSHASHASHYSGSGGYAPTYPPPSTYTPPEPPPAPSYPAPSVPRSTLAPSHSLAPESSTGNPTTTDPLQLLVMRVQVALYAAGYDPGAVDGILSEPTRQALRQFQAARGLSISGRMTTETLNALGVSLPR